MKSLVALAQSSGQNYSDSPDQDSSSDITDGSSERIHVFRDKHSDCIVSDHAEEYKDNSRKNQAVVAYFSDID